MMREDDARVGELREACSRQDWLAACEALSQIEHPDLRDAMLRSLPADLLPAARLMLAGDARGERWLDAIGGEEPGLSVEVLWELLELRRVEGAALRWRGPWEDLVCIQITGVRWEDLRQARWRLGREWHRVLPEPVSVTLANDAFIIIVFLRTYLEQVREFIDAEDGDWDELEVPAEGQLDEDEREHLIPLPDGELLWVALT